MQTVGKSLRSVQSCHVIQLCMDASVWDGVSAISIINVDGFRPNMSVVHHGTKVN